MMLTLMDGVRTIIKLLGDLLTFIWLILRPHGALAAENLFLRKQLAMYQERKLKPRRPDTPFRVALVLLSRLPMAPPRLSPVLALEVTAKAATDTGGTARCHPRDGARQSWLGRGAHCQ
jgi:hypothetical protein